MSKKPSFSIAPHLLALAIFAGGGLAFVSAAGSAKPTAVGGQSAAAGGMFAPDFVVAEYDGKPIRNSDLGRAWKSQQTAQYNQWVGNQRKFVVRYLYDKYGPNKLDASKLSFTLEEERLSIQVSGDDASRGSKDAPVTIVEFSDYNCGYCAKVNPTLQKLFEDYKGKVRHVFKDFAFLSPLSVPMANAAQCVREQKPAKFWDYQKELFSKKSELYDQLKGQSNKENALAQADVILAQFAGNIGGINLQQFKKCQTSKKYTAQIEKSQEMGQKLGVQGTPAVFINGKFINGAMGYEGFKEIIDAELN